MWVKEINSKQTEQQAQAPSLWQEIVKVFNAIDNLDRWLIVSWMVWPEYLKKFCISAANTQWVFDYIRWNAVA